MRGPRVIEDEEDGMTAQWRLYRVTEEPWRSAARHLSDVEDQVKGAIGSGRLARDRGLVWLAQHLRQLELAFERGDRSGDLWDRMMALKPPFGSDE
jgi:hypothetical protein